MRGWTCQRQLGGEKCAHRNPIRKKKCEMCGKPRPARRVPAHRSALEVPYAAYVGLMGVEVCGICGRPPTRTRRLDRDHDHNTGKPRGLLCARCNRALPRWITPEWLRKAAEYLERTQI